MLESLLQPYDTVSEPLDDTIYTCFFLQALYWSLGAGLTEPARITFDAQVKYLASMTSVDEGEEGVAKLGKTKKIKRNSLIRFVSFRFVDIVQMKFRHTNQHYMNTFSMLKNNFGSHGNV